MKRWFSSIVVLALLTVLLAACGSGSNNSATSNDGTNAGGTNAGTNANAAKTTDDSGAAGDVTGTITFLSQHTDMIGKEFDDYAKRFHEKYPNAEVKFEAVQDYDNTLKVRIASGKYPDVVLIPPMPNSDLPQYFEPLDDLGLNDKIYFKDFRATGGKVYGIASGGNTSGIVYNKTAFAKAGITEIPKTLDEFMADCEKLKEKGIVPLASNFKDKWPLNNWYDDVSTLIAGDANLSNNRAKTDAPYALDNPYGKALSIVKEMYEKGYLEKDINSTNWEQSKKDIAQGNFAMYLLGNWVINQIIQNGAKSEDIGFFPFPADNSGTVKASLGPDYNYAVNKNSKNVATAKAFVKWLIEDSGYEKFAGYIPVLKDRQPDLKQLADFLAMKPQIIESVPTDDTAQAIENKSQLDKSVLVQEFVLSKNPQEILDKYNKKWAEAKKALGK